MKLKHINNMENEVSEYRKYIFEVDVEELPEILDEVSKEIVPKSSDHGITYFFTKGLKTLDIDDDSLAGKNTYHIIMKKYYKLLHKVITLQHRFAKEGFLFLKEEEDPEDPARKFRIKFSKIFEIMYYWEQMIRSAWCVKKASDPEYDSSMNDDIGLFRFKDIKPEDNTPYQNLILYLTTILAERGYRRQGDNCMKRIYTEEGYDTHAWKPEMEIDDFFYKSTNKDYNYQQWHNSTISPMNCKNAIKYLKTMSDINFIDVVKDRKLFSFVNGLYETSVYNEKTNCWEDRWYYHKNGDSKKVEPSRSACNYFDIPLIDVLEHDNWEDIPTPWFQSILDYQEFTPDVCKWMYILVIGRMLYEVSELDGWQVMPFLKGRAKSGKSTILTQVTKKLFHILDIGVLSNNVEKKFGLSAFKDKFLFIAPEVKGDIGLEQCDFQTIISGEDTSVPEKFKTAKAVTWKVPCAMAGNAPPDYKDNQGSVSRRVAVFEFSKAVIKGDTQLGKKLGYELPALLVKGNRAYLEAVNKYGKNDIWSILPEYFTETKKEMAEQTNSLQHYLGSGKVVFGDEHWVLQSHFTREFNDRWNKDYYMNPFELKGIEIKHRMLRYDPITSREKKGTWFHGVDIVREVEENDEDDLN